jgi:Ankyrin repeats (3 copies)
MRPLLTDLWGNPIYVMSRAARLRTRFRHPHLPTLFYHVQNRAWNDVLRRSKSHPQEVVVQEDVSKNTCLHIACRLDPPVEVIRALKKAARMRNADGCTPLHIAASHRISEPALEVLLECAAAQPLTAATTACTMHHASYKSQHPTADLSRCGRAPIHYACLSFRGLELNAFQRLLEATLKDGNVLVDDEYYSKRLLGLDDFFNEDEEASCTTLQLHNSSSSLSCTMDSTQLPKKTLNAMTIRDSSGQAPLGLLFRRYRERMRAVINTVDRLWREHSDNPNKAALASAISVHAELGTVWQRARYILARLTQERLEKDGTDKTGFEGASSGYGVMMMENMLNKPLSPGEIAVAKEAATWAAEQHNMVNTFLLVLLILTQSFLRVEWMTWLCFATHRATFRSPIGGGVGVS